MASFSAQINNFSSLTMEKALKVKKQAAFELFRAIVYQTPVLDGYLRNNWFVTIGNGTTETTADADASGSGAVRKAELVLAQASLPKDIYFTNNLPYAYRIEFDGYSAKAPAGMVRVNVTRWDRMVEKAARRVARER